MYIKICGITNLEDAQMAVSAGADALGFNFYPQSKRFIDPSLAAEIISQLPASIDKIGLFVNHLPDQIQEIDDLCHFDFIQIHGDESPEFCLAWQHRLIRALRLSDRDDLEMLNQYYFAKMIIVDAAVKGVYGGSGQLANWSLAKAAQAGDVAILLAGGLTPENVAAAIGAVAPFGVDVAGGVEASPGIKDPIKVKKFIENCRKLS